MFHVGTCPHCSTNQLALEVVRVVRVKEDHANLYLKCPNCHQPICAWVSTENSFSEDTYMKWERSTKEMGIRIMEMWPPTPSPQIPQGIPESAAKAMLQGETNFNQANHEDAAAVMYRKALEVSLKNIDPGLRGTLAQRIQKLAESGRLTADLADWALSIKNLGNDGAHEIEGIDRKELESMRGLVSMVLTYLFTLPQQVKALREKVAETP